MKPPPGSSPPVEPPPAADAVPALSQKGQENAHREAQDPVTEQAWLGNETNLPCCPLADQTKNYRLRRIERTTRRAATAFENGEFAAGITHLENALRLALLQRALDTTEEGLRQ